MPCPYVSVFGKFHNSNDTLHVVGHNNEFVQLYVMEMFENSQSTFSSNFLPVVESKLSLSPFLISSSSHKLVRNFHTKAQMHENST